MFNYSGGLQMYPYNNGPMPYFGYDVLDNATNRRHNHLTDIFDCEEFYMMRIDLAGYNKEAIKVGITDNRLIISASGYALDYGDKFINQEISHGDFMRKYDIKDIDRDKIEVSYCAGIIELKLPKNPKENELKPFEREFQL